MRASEEFSVHHAEGRLRQSISVKQMYVLWAIVILTIGFVLFRIGYLQVIRGKEYAYISENNTFAKKIVLPLRGTVHDRNGEQLAWNIEQLNDEVPRRRYREGGFSTLLGFIRYPQKDKHGVYYRENTEGETGIEEIYDHLLTGASGSLVREKNASGDVLSELYIEKQTDGEDVEISIDAEAQSMLFESIKKIADERDFDGGSGTLIDIETGEVLVLTSYPEFDNNAVTNLPSEKRTAYVRGQDKGAFVHRAVSGLYSPGSTVKPFFAIAALESGVITPDEIIVSTGSISVQNPYDPAVVYTYNDWKAHGPLTMYDALAQSSNVYFYYIGGGYGNRDGLGIDRLKVYANIFGFGIPTSLSVFNEPHGLIPDPEWKNKEYDEEWRVGDTYNTVIGQYAFQATPLQLARATAAIANGGYLIEPHFNKGQSSGRKKLAVSDESLSVAQRGMRRAVTRGIAGKLKTEDYSIAAKTGTAQVGKKGIVNSLLVGFFPYEKPRYAFAIVMERGSGGGATTVARLFFDGLMRNAPEYLK